MELIKPKNCVFYDAEGNAHEYILSKFDAIKGREIITKYLMSNLPKLGDYEVSEQTMLELMNFVAVPMENGAKFLRLSTRALVNNHVPDWEMLGQIEKEMVGYNASFFRAEKISSFFEWLAERMLGKIFELSSLSSEPSSQQNSQPSTNSEQPTT